jgi:hypothetical protein
MELEFPPPVPETMDDITSVNDIEQYIFAQHRWERSMSNTVSSLFEYAASGYTLRLVAYQSTECESQLLRQERLIDEPASSLIE